MRLELGPMGAERRGHLPVSGSRTVNSVRRNLVKSINLGLNRLRTVIQVERSVGLDIQIYSTLGEVTYAWCLAKFTDVILEGWSYQLMVLKQAL